MTENGIQDLYDRAFEQWQNKNKNEARELIDQALALLPERGGPLRQPYFTLAQAFEEESGARLATFKEAVHRAPPHSLAESRLRRRLWDWETKDIRLDFTPLLLLLEEKRYSESTEGPGPQPIPYANLNEVLRQETHPVFLLKGAPGVELLDERRDGGYPTAVTEGANNDQVYVGRVREDISHDRGLDLWVVADNVRKGAALNSIQIAEILVKDYL